MTELQLPHGPRSQKYLLSGPIEKKVVNPCFRMDFPFFLLKYNLKLSLKEDHIIHASNFFPVIFTYNF